MAGNLRENLKGCVDKILEVRENIGVQLADVELITRTWSGEEVGDGTSTDVVVKMSPAPQIVDFGHDVRLQETSTVRQGDLILKQISQNKYTLADLKPTTDTYNVEKFFRINGNLYVVIHVKERQLTWEVHIRKTSHSGIF